MATNKPGLKRMIFKRALKDKLKNLRRNGRVSHYIWDRCIFHPIKKKLGLDRVEHMLSGAAPLAANTLEFFRILLGRSTFCHEGYGQTETCGATTLTASEDLTLGHVGYPFPGLEIKLIDVPEMGYFHSDTRHHHLSCAGRGEICVRGPGVFVGYYKDDVSTKAALDNDGWLHSGDIGMWMSGGQLAVIDRRKNVLKLSQGEFVALEKIETILSRAPLVSQIFVHGESTESFLVAIVVPDEEQGKFWARDHATVNHDDHLWTRSPSLPELCEMTSFRNAVLEQMRQQAQVAGLFGYEFVKAVYLESRTWVPEGFQAITSIEGESTTIGLLTPTLKLKRIHARNVYRDQLSRLYTEQRAIIRAAEMTPSSHKYLATKKSVTRIWSSS